MGNNFWQEKIFWKSDMTLYFEKSYHEFPLKKVVYNQSVPHIHPPASPLVSGRELIFFRETRLQFLLSQTPFRFTIYKSLVLQKHKETKIESNEYLNNITICLVQ